MRIRVGQAAAMLLLTATVTACTASSTSGTHSGDGTSSKTSAAPPAARVGSAVTLHGLNGQVVAVTLDKVLTVAHGTGGERPAKGHRFFAARLTVRNSGTTRLDEGPWISTQVVDSKGQQYDTAAVEGITAGPELPGSIKTTAGQSRAGWIVFEIPTGARITTIQYGASGGLGDQGEWTI